MADTTKRILLVDPNNATRGFHKALLQEAGYRVEEARNGVEGLERLQKEACALVVACVEMPKMDGLTLAQQVRTQSPDPALPLLLMGISGDEAARRMALQAGANLFLSMDSGAEELLPMVDLMTATERP